MKWIAHMVLTLQDTQTPFVQNNGDIVVEASQPEETRTDTPDKSDPASSDAKSDSEDVPKPPEETSSLKFHEMLEHHVGEFGWYQVMFTLHKFFQNLTGAMYTFVTVFIAATPEHTCDIDDQIPTELNCTHQQKVDLFIPKETRHGQTVPSQCQFYNISLLATQLLAGSNSRDVCPANFTSTDLPLVKCDKWTYDRSFYDSTLVSEVRLHVLCVFTCKCLGSPRMKSQRKIRIKIAGLVQR